MVQGPEPPEPKFPKGMDYRKGLYVGPDGKVLGMSAYEDSRFLRKGQKKGLVQDLKPPIAKKVPTVPKGPNRHPKKEEYERSSLRRAAKKRVSRR